MFMQVHVYVNTIKEAESNQRFISSTKYLL